MKTTEQMMKREIQRYIKHGFSLRVAVAQVKSLYLGRHDRAIDSAAKQLEA